MLHNTDFMANLSYVAGNDKTYLCLHINCQMFLSDFRKKNWICQRNFHKSPPVSDFTEIGPMEAELIYADRRTGLTKLIGAFRDYAKSLNEMFT